MSGSLFRILELFRIALNMGNRKNTETRKHGNRETEGNMLLAGETCLVPAPEHRDRARNQDLS